VDRLRGVLANNARIEALTLKKALSSGNQAGEMEALLWLPLEKDAAYWKKREIRALDGQAPPWRVNVPNQNTWSKTSDQDSDRISKLLQKLGGKLSLNTATQALTTGGHDFPNLPLEQLKEAYSMADYADRGSGKGFRWTRSLPVFSRLTALPSRLNGSRDRLIRFISIIRRKSFIIHSETSVSLTDGRLAIPTPQSGSDHFALSSLQIYSGQGKRLYAGTDYQLIQDQEHGTWESRFWIRELTKSVFRRDLSRAGPKHVETTPNFATLRGSRSGRTTRKRRFHPPCTVLWRQAVKVHRFQTLTAGFSNLARSRNSAVVSTCFGPLGTNPGRKTDFVKLPDPESRLPRCRVPGPGSTGSLFRRRAACLDPNKSEASSRQSDPTLTGAWGIAGAHP